MTAAPIIRIVDDDPNIHDALAYVLENEGFIVRHYESAESFLINDRPEDPGWRDSRRSHGGNDQALFCMTG